MWQDWPTWQGSKFTSGDLCKYTKVHVVQWSGTGWVWGESWHQNVFGGSVSVFVTLAHGRNKFFQGKKQPTVKDKYSCGFVCFVLLFVFAIGLAGETGSESEKSPLMIAGKVAIPSPFPSAVYTYTHMCLVWFSISWVWNSICKVGRVGSSCLNPHATWWPQNFCVFIDSDFRSFCSVPFHLELPEISCLIWKPNLVVHPDWEAFRGQKTIRILFMTIDLP